MIYKKFEKELENCSEEDLRALEGLQDLFQFLDDLIPLSDEEEEETGRVKKRFVFIHFPNPPPKPIPLSRRSQSTGSLGVDGGPDEDDGVSGPGRPNK